MKALKLEAPRDYVLRRDACSYGYFLLAPNHWEPATRTLTRVLDLEDGPVRCDITQAPGRKGAALTVRLNRSVSRLEAAVARAQLVRMLRLDEPHGVITAFHALDPRWKRSGRGRLMRSPTLFEDVIKTVTSCNVTWPSTVNMNTRLCEVVGRGGAFPTAARLARVRPGNLRGRCRVGYRDVRIIELSRRFARGAINEAWMADPATSDADVRAALIELPGIGPYAAHNIMQLLGRYGHIPLDSESVRHGRTVLGYKGTAAKVLKKVGRHYKGMGGHKFRSYWFELWDFYEAKRGKSWTWEREKVGSSFTASQF